MRYKSNKRLTLVHVSRSGKCERSLAGRERGRRLAAITVLVVVVVTVVALATYRFSLTSGLRGVVIKPPEPRELRLGEARETGGDVAIVVVVTIVVSVVVVGSDGGAGCLRHAIATRVHAFFKEPLNGLFFFTSLPV